MKAVILDLEEDILELLAYTLEKAGFEAVPVDEEAQLVSLASIHTPDLVLIGNCSAPEVRTELVQALRALPGLSGTIIIFLSTDPLCDGDPMCHKSGADGCIQTPVTPRELICYIREIAPALVR
ncbi:MAG: response regulator [Bacteroidetes bacterium]|nr:MAG: response regulator [Bacteroidota bacterium]